MRSSYFPDNKPDARGTRAITPAPAREQVGEQFFHRLQAKSVEYHLDRSHPGPLDGPQPLCHRFDRHAVSTEDAIVYHVVESVEDTLVFVHPFGRAMQLGERYGRDPEVFPAPFGPVTERFRGVVGRVLGHSPPALGSHQQLGAVTGALGQKAADQTFAAPIAVDVGGVKKGYAGIGGGVQGKPSPAGR